MPRHSCRFLKQLRRFSAIIWHSRCSGPRLAMSRKSMIQLFAVAAIATLASAPLYASARLTYTMGDHSVQVAWPASAFPIQYQVDRRVMNSLPNAQAVID